MVKYISFEKIASTDEKGNLWLCNELTEGLLSDLNDPNLELSVLKTLLNIAQKAVENDDEDLGLRLFEKVLRKTAYRVHTENELLPLAEEALRGIGVLYSSNSEYIWEISSQLYSDFDKIIHPKSYE